MIMPSYASAPPSASEPGIRPLRCSKVRLGPQHIHVHFKQPLREITLLGRPEELQVCEALSQDQRVRTKQRYDAGVGMSESGQGCIWWVSPSP